MKALTSYQDWDIRSTKLVFKKKKKKKKEMKKKITATTTIHTQELQTTKLFIATHITLNNKQQLETNQYTRSIIIVSPEIEI